MTRKSTTSPAPADAAVKLAVPATGGSFERQPDGSLKRLNDIVEDVAEPADGQPADEGKDA
ncbi:hypothetical protein [Sphingomonas panni]|uniref:hypothetical protein n=1 Tax=Sphingomonas panni TaxID=237612 RepID=UPI001F5B71FF|nr:hypothetical protein [Sphingomonas panni]